MQAAILGDAADVATYVSLGSGVLPVEMLAAEPPEYGRRLRHFS